MKIQEVLTLAEPDFPRDARPVAADRPRTVLAPVQAPDRIVRLGSHDVTDDLSLAPDPSPTSPMTISPAHRPDLDFIKNQLARLPRRTEP
jgi:hypothetical protein